MPLITYTHLLLISSLDFLEFIGKMDTSVKYCIDLLT